MRLHSRVGVARLFGCIRMLVLIKSGEAFPNNLVDSCLFSSVVGDKNIHFSKDKLLRKTELDSMISVK